MQTAKNEVAYAGILVAEEVLDVFQRGCMRDDRVLDFIRTVNEIHVLEESRHMKFAREQVQAGVPLYRAVVEAARQRFRPIIMTSIAFSLGVTPLVLSSGAGAAGRNAIGATVLGGTVMATIFGILFAPLFYVLMRRLLGRGDVMDDPTPDNQTTGMPPRQTSSQF